DEALDEEIDGRVDPSEQLAGMAGQAVVGQPREQFVAAAVDDLILARAVPVAPADIELPAGRPRRARVPPRPVAVIQAALALFIGCRPASEPVVQADLEELDVLRHAR